MIHKYSAKNFLSVLISMLIVVYITAFSIWTIFYTETANGDNVEHIHSTWLIAQGKIPYKDFFQHHNPLLWYIFSPLFKILPNALIMLDVAHAIAIIGGFITFFIVYKICTRFFASKLPSIISIITLCPIYFYIYCFNYNPDTFMALFLAIGIYFLFKYFAERKIVNLTISFLAFFISFMFTQKVLIVLGVLGVISLFVFYKEKVQIIDILYSITLPILCLMLFVAYLYNKDALSIYWQSNYTFNVVMQKYYGLNKISVVDYEMLITSSLLSLASILVFFYKGTVYFRVISILFVTELLLRCFYFSIAPYYMLPMMICSCCLNSVLIEKIINKKHVFIYLFFALAVYYSSISKTKYLSTRGQNRDFATYISQNITPCDYVISSFFGNQSIISKDPYYYWSMLGHIDVAGEEVGIYPKPNVNELVVRYLPKLIFTGIYWDSYSKNRNKGVAIQQISSDIVNKYYLPTPFMDFSILKYEYRKNNCKYNQEKGEWQYED
ncbi:MAG: glycosyltransferase family 39 protein [Alphaproteobacteria bacterium]|nr:glycosyltransferase family 39 protein [Alphaproteobacteria bacterium]